MSWIRIGFNADLKSSFISMRIKIRIWIQGAKRMRIHAAPDPDPGQTSKSQKLNFFTWNKAYLRRYKRLSGCPFPCSWIRIRIRIPNTYPDLNPVQPNQWGSVLIRIHNTAQNRSLILKTGLILMGNKFWIPKSESLTGLESSVSDLDCIQIQSGQWIRIQEGKNAP